MDPDLFQTTPLAIVGGALAYTLARAIPDAFRKRNKSSLEYVLGSKEVRKLKKRIAREESVRVKDVTITPQSELTVGSTISDGGFNRRYGVCINGNVAKVLYWKQDSLEGVQLVRERFGKIPDNNPTEAEFSAILQRYVTEQINEPIDFVPRVYSTNSLGGSLCEAIEGETLMQQLTTPRPTQDRRDLFKRVVERVELLTERLEGAREYIETVTTKERTKSREYRTRHFLMSKLEDDAEDLITRIGYDSCRKDIILEDLHPGNIIEDKGEINLIDLTVGMGRFADQLYGLQVELGLVDDEQTERYVDQVLESKFVEDVNCEKSLARVRFHVTQIARVEEHRQRAQDDQQDLLDEFASYHIKKALEYAPENAIKNIQKLGNFTQDTRDFGLQLGSKHPFEIINSNQNNTQRDNYEERISQVRAEQRKELDMTNLSAATGILAWGASPFIAPEIVSSPSYWLLGAGVAMGWYLCERFTKLTSRNPFKAAQQYLTH